MKKIKNNQSGFTPLEKSRPKGLKAVPLAGRSQTGFTLIEILIVIGLIAVLAGVVLVAVNPGRQFAQARNSQRQSNVSTILDAIGQNIADNKGVFSCATAIPTSTAAVMGSSTGMYNIAPCLVPTYLPALPYDPLDTTASYTSTSSYNTGYSILQDAAGRVTIHASSTELEIPTISVTR